MRFRLDFHPELASAIQSLTNEELSELHAKLELVRQEPIKHSEAFVDPGMSKYVMRCFRIGKGVEKIVIFSCDPAHHSVKVLRCRAARTRRSPG